jgi:glycosyltransferase involved in cell wall biosynthesis
MAPVHIVNVCFVGSLGLADYTLSLARSLTAHARSTIITAGSFDYPHVSFSGDVIRLFRRSRHYPIDIFRFLARALSMRPEVLVYQAPLKFPLFDGLVARVLRLRGVRVATTVHDVLPHYPRAWSPMVYRFFYSSFDRLIAHSNAAKAKLTELGIKAPILVVPHGVYDIYQLSNLSRHEARTRLGRIDDDEFVALFFGSIDERKGIGELVDVVSRMDPGSRIKIVIAGANAISLTNSDLRRRFKAIESSPCCKVVARRIGFDEVETYFAAADVVLLPYLEGTTSGVLKLAMAFGKPVIATDVGDAPETVGATAGILISHRRVREELPAALEQMRARYASYQQQWAAVTSGFAWAGIGARYFEFLSAGLPRRT